MLMQARADARRREMATLVALGAGRRRLISQTVVESLVLAGAGVVLALPMAAAGSRAMVLMLTTDREPWHVALSLDWRSVVCAGVAAAATALIFGVLPALQSSRFDLVTVLRTSGRSLTLDRRRLIVQRSLVTGQLAMCFVLIYAALVFVHSFRNVVGSDLGFDPRDVKVVSFVDPSIARRSMDDRRQFQRRLIETMAAMPGVQSAGAISQVPLSGASWTQAFAVPGSPERRIARFSYVSPQYFETMRIPLRSGRTFTERDTTNASPVAIVNETFVRTFLGGDPSNARGIQTLAEPRYPPTHYEVIGVVGDAKYADAREDSVAIAYVPLDQMPVLTSWKSVLVRTRLPRPLVEQEAKQRVGVLGAGIRVATVDLSSRLGDRLVRDRMLAWLSAAFGALAVSLAAIGLYGLIAYVSASRRSEIGVRLALGASRADVIVMMLRQTAALLMAGLVAGVALSIIAGRAATALLYQVVPGDPPMLIVATMVLAGVASLAAVVPAWRASRVDPMSTLRAEGS
jgi:predicted permease